MYFRYFLNSINYYCTFESSQIKNKEIKISRGVDALAAPTKSKAFNPPQIPMTENITTKEPQNPNQIPGRIRCSIYRKTAIRSPTPIDAYLE